MGAGGAGPVTNEHVISIPEQGSKHMYILFALLSCSEKFYIQFRLKYYLCLERTLTDKDSPVTRSVKEIFRVVYSGARTDTLTRFADELEFECMHRLEGDDRAPMKVLTSSRPGVWDELRGKAIFTRIPESAEHKGDGGALDTRGSLAVSKLDQDQPSLLTLFSGVSRCS